MARVRKRSSESVEDSKLLRTRGGRPKPRARAHRRLADPVDFLRRVRYVARHANSTWDQAAWEDEKTDLLFRCAAIDPCLQAIPPAEAAASDPDHDPEATTVVAAVSHLPVTAIEDPQQRQLAFAVAGIRRMLERTKGPAQLTESERRDLCLLANGVQRAIVESTEPLNPLAQALWDHLLSLPEDRPQTAPALQAAIERKGVICHSVQVRRELSGSLQRKGVRNDRGLGYYVPSELRPDTAPSDPAGGR